MTATSLAPAADPHRLSRAEVARAIPPGSRRIRSQREALRRGLACPDLADVRADFRAHLTAFWRVHVLHSSWGGPDSPPSGTTEPTRARVCERTGMSVSTYKACRRWWESRGYLAIVRPGSTPDMRPAVLRSPSDGNVRQAYVLCVPRENKRSPRLVKPSQPLTRPLSKSRRDLDRFPAREEGKNREPASARTGAPRSRLLRTGTLKNLTDGWWAHITRPFANWSAADVVWAVDHLPGGTQHRTKTANVRHPAGWLRWRLSHWLGADGKPLPSPSQARAAAAEQHRVYLEQRDRELGLAARGAAIRAASGYQYESAVPAAAPAWTPPPAPHRGSAGPRLVGWAARRPAGRAAPQTEERTTRLPDWWTAIVTTAAAAVAAEEAMAAGDTGEPQRALFRHPSGLAPAGLGSRGETHGPDAMMR